MTDPTPPSTPDDDERRALRLAPPLPVPVTSVQIADFPDAYAVRRGGPAEAIIHQADTGDWMIMYAHVPDVPEGAEQWRGSAVLSRRLTMTQAAEAAVELVDACGRLDVAPSWPELLGRLIDAGPTVAAVGRLHAPDDSGFCTGDNPSDPPAWIECRTVEVLAATVGLQLVDLAFPDDA